jgi:hypothetical protein
MLRAVIDTNVIVSGVLSKKGAPARLLDAWSERRFNLVISEAILAEVQRVLSEPRLKQVFCIPDGRIARLVETLREDGTLVPGSAAVHGAVLADPSDEKFLAAALDGGADMLVSGDKHLLALGSFQGMVILTPRQFLDQLEAGE